MSSFEFLPENQLIGEDADATKKFEEASKPDEEKYFAGELLSEARDLQKSIETAKDKKYADSLAENRQNFLKEVSNYNSNILNEMPDYKLSSSGEDSPKKARFMYKTFGSRPESSAKYLKEQMPNFDARLEYKKVGDKISPTGNVVLVDKKDPNKQYRLDPQGFDVQDLSDILGDTAIGIIQGAATAGAALVSGPAALPVAMATSGASGAALEAGRQGIGKSFGVSEEMHPEDIVASGLIGTAMPAIFGTGVSQQMAREYALKKLLEKQGIKVSTQTLKKYSSEYGKAAEEALKRGSFGGETSSAISSTNPLEGLTGQTRQQIGKPINLPTVEGIPSVPQTTTEAGNVVPFRGMEPLERDVLNIGSERPVREIGELTTRGEMGAGTRQAGKLTEQELAQQRMRDVGSGGTQQFNFSPDDINSQQSTDTITKIIKESTGKEPTVQDVEALKNTLMSYQRGIPKRLYQGAENIGRQVTSALSGVPTNIIKRVETNLEKIRASELDPNVAAEEHKRLVNSVIAPIKEHTTSVGKNIELIENRFEGMGRIVNQFDAARPLIEYRNKVMSSDLTPQVKREKLSLVDDLLYKYLYEPKVDPKTGITRYGLREGMSVRTAKDFSKNVQNEARMAGLKLDKMGQLKNMSTATNPVDQDFLNAARDAAKAARDTIKKTISSIDKETGVRYENLNSEYSSLLNLQKDANNPTKSGKAFLQFFNNKSENAKTDIGGLKSRLEKASGKNMDDVIADLITYNKYVEPSILPKVDSNWRYLLPAAGSIAMNMMSPIYRNPNFTERVLMGTVPFLATSPYVQRKFIQASKFAKELPTKETIPFIEDLLKVPLPYKQQQWSIPNKGPLAAPIIRNAPQLSPYLMMQSISQER